jgi:hypothetical protein
MGLMILEVGCTSFPCTGPLLLTRTGHPGWTLRGVIQDHIDVYVSLDTFTEVKRSFPYLVAKEFASGGGDVSVILQSIP